MKQILQTTTQRIWREKEQKNATAVIADCQTAGKGRMGRSFCSPHGTSIYLSIILRLKPIWKPVS